MVAAVVRASIVSDAAWTVCYCTYICSIIVNIDSSDAKCMQ